MSMIPSFSRPSDPTKKVTLCGASVRDMIDFADVDARHEEEITTLFLNRLQDKATYTDSRLWTGEDRRLALFWYWIHTAQTSEIEMPIEYDCDYCNGRHPYIQDMRALGNGYKEIAGKAERDNIFDGEKIIIRPLNGGDLEVLESMRLSLEGDPNSGAYRKQAAEIKVERIIRQLAFDGNEKLKPEEKLEATRKRVLGLSPEMFRRLTAVINEALDDMKHGLDSVYQDDQILLILPPHRCPNAKSEEETTRLRYRFRNSDYIPQLL